LQSGLDEFNPIEGQEKISSDEEYHNDPNNNKPLLHATISSTSLLKAEGSKLKAGS
jgi:hypothetical protein